MAPFEERVLLEKCPSGWFVRNSGGSERGPYFKASIAVTVAVKEVLQARRSEGEACVFVGQGGGRFSRCKLADLPSAPCNGCESYSETRANLCPLRAELSAR
jgi:hypothetical protein